MPVHSQNKRLIESGIFPIQQNKTLIQPFSLQITKRSVYVCSMVNENQHINSIMRKVLIAVGIMVGMFIIVTSAKAQEKNLFLYGDVETVGGDTYTGFIRWGDDEVYWVELLNAKKSSNDFLKYLSKREVEELSEQGEGNSWLGIDLGVLSIWEDKYSRTNHRFDTRFGDIASIEPVSKSKALIKIKNGVIIEVDNQGGYYSDIGGGVVILDNELGEVNLKWNRIELITFKTAPEDAPEPFGRPIYGTVDAGRKGTFSGLIQWDMDERFLNEVLDGKTRGDDREIPFRSIKAIEKERNGALVILNSGREFVLTGSNDVNNENRGVVVFDPEVGRIQIPWRDFMRAEFTHDSVTGLSYDDFPVSQGLSGTIKTIEGDEYAGLLVYDLDESWEFEILDGKDDNVEFDIPFRNVKSIIPRNYNYSMVELKNGTSILIGDERDVTSDNDGILVFTSKNSEPIYIKWSKIDEIIFD